MPRLRATALSAAILVWFSPSQAATYNWTGGSSSSGWSSSTNWSNNTVPTFDNTADLNFNVLNRGTNYIGTNRTVRSMTFGPNIDSAFVVQYMGFPAATQVAYSLTMGADSNNSSITVDADAAGNITLGTNAGNTSALGSLVLATNLNVIHNGTGVLLFNRGIANTNGSYGITKTGTGTMVFGSIGSSPNTFTGDININSGTVLANGFVVATDMNNAARINLGGGGLVIANVSGANKDYTQVGLNVNAASSLAWSNTGGATTYTLTFSGTNTFALNSQLTVKNNSTNTSAVNAMNISRSITGSGDLVVETYNDISSSTNNYSLGRLLLTGTNSGWNGNLVVAKGTVSLGGSNTPSSGAGAIVIGTTGDAFGAGVTFFPTAASGSTVTFSNDLTVRTGGFRSIKGSGTDHSIIMSGDVVLEGSLNLDSTLSGGASARTLALGGSISGPGGLAITRNTGSTNTFVRLSGTNTYTGATDVTSGTLVINGDNSAASGDVTVAAGASLGGTGTIGGATTISGIHNPGTSPGIQSFTSGLVYNSGAVVNWELTANTASLGDRGSSYDGIDLLGPANLNFAGATTMNLSFNSQGSTVRWSDAFWAANRSWLVYDMNNGVASNFNDLGLSTSDWSDNAAALFNTARPGSSFSLTQTGEDIFLVYTVPEPSTYALFGLAVVAFASRVVVRRRRAAR